MNYKGKPPKIMTEVVEFAEESYPVVNRFSDSNDPVIIGLGRNVTPYISGLVVKLYGENKKPELPFIGDIRTAKKSIIAMLKEEISGKKAIGIDLTFDSGTEALLKEMLNDIEYEGFLYISIHPFDYKKL